MTGSPIVVTDANFFSTMKRQGFMLTDFWAEWCGPCRMVAPIIEELAKEYEGKVTFAKLNVDDNPLTPEQFGIMSIPTMIVSNGGRVIDVLIGAMPKEALKQKVESYLRASTSA